MSTTIPVDDLRVGMFVQLDGGWMHHPFATSSFCISEARQVALIRRMGVSHVRWVPEKSELVHDSAPGQVGPAAQAATPAAETKAPEALHPLADAEPNADDTRRCERQFAAAVEAWRQANQLVLTDPLGSGAQVVALARQLHADMPDDCDINIRLLSAQAQRGAAHAMNVAVISLLMGRSLGLSAAELIDLGAGALAHDVGKLKVADRHRSLEDGAAAPEVTAYRDHVAQGVELGQSMALSPGALAVLAQHHEYADGSGFPLGLKGDRLSLAARIVAIVDCYDKMCNPATRKVPLTPHEAVATLFAQGHRRFESTVLNAFIRLMGIYPAGSLVQLTDDRYALVMGLNASRPLKPCVRVFGGEGGKAARTHWVDLQQTPDLGIRRSLPTGRVPAEALQALNPCPQVIYYFEARPTRPHGEQARAA